MSYFKAEQNGRAIIGIGLDKRRMKRLLEGEVWLITGEHIGFQGDILVMGGDTEIDIAKRVRANMTTIWQAGIAKPNG